MNRRDFLNAATRGAVATAALATPALAAAGAAGADLYDRLTGEITALRDALGERLDNVAGDIGKVTDRVRRLELQHQLILYLLVISFVVDGGLSWLMLHSPVMPVA